MYQRNALHYYAIIILVSVCGMHYIVTMLIVVLLSLVICKLAKSTICISYSQIFEKYWTCFIFKLKQ